MSPDRERLAWLAAVAGVAFLLVAAATHWLGPAQLSPAALLAGLALLLGSAVLQPGLALRLARERRSRQAAPGLAGAAVIIAALVALNIVAAQGSQALDLTRAQLNTLAPQSVRAVRQLRAPLTITGFYSAQNQSSQQTEQQLLALYQSQSSRVQVRFLDPAKNGGALRQLGVHEDGSLVLQYQGRSQVLLPGAQAEQDVTGAIITLESKRTPVVCWAVGDGERDLTNQDQYLGYSSAAAELAKNNLAVESFLLPEAGAVPPACAAVTVVGPTRPLTPASVKLLQTWVSGGGRLLVALDPWQPAAVLSSVNRLLQPFQLGFGGGLVVDPQSVQGDTSTAAVFAYGGSPIVAGLQRQVSLFPQATPVAVSGVGPGLATTVAASSANSYEVLRQRSDWRTRRASDAAGPFPLMATVELGSRPHDTRVVAVGTGSFADNQMLSLPSVNVQLLTGSLQWLTNQQNLISLPPRPPATVSLALTNDEAHWNLFITLLLMPLLVAGGGVAVWWRRRFALA